ncbi:MAG TPA: rhodanese-like domain-containing protein, partial [Gemmatimonadaceae bacterium]|nr:rhodanese-like domain-containing protein [Gemmatimonadaceae bacterium]
TVIDVRNPYEYAEGHIEGAKNIPLGVVGERFAEIPTDKPIVVHCQGGTRSSIAASVLQKQGVSNVINLTGGFGAWKKAGGEVKTEGTS